MAIQTSTALIPYKSQKDFLEEQYQKIVQSPQIKVVKNRSVFAPPFQKSWPHQVVFIPLPYPSTIEKVKRLSLSSALIGDKPVYEIADFFSSHELNALREVLSYEYSIKIFGNRQSQIRGETPCQSMQIHKSWEKFFQKPCLPMQEISKFIGHLSFMLNAEALLQPVKICSTNSGCLEAIPTNLVESMTEQSSIAGLHKDYDPALGLPYRLIGENLKEFPNKFTNGSRGMPWLVSLIVYATEPHFQQAYGGLGTIFYDDQGSIAHKVPCLHGNIVLFEGDILHGIAPSDVSNRGSAKRVSLVYKLAFLPKAERQSVREDFERIFSKKIARSLSQEDEKSH